MRKQVYRYDQKTGVFIEPVILLEEDPIPLDCTETEPNIPNWKPVWDGKEWQETITPEELANLQTPPKLEEWDKWLELKLALAELAELITVGSNV